jgi:hypothetical protein
VAAFYDGGFWADAHTGEIHHNFKRVFKTEAAAKRAVERWLSARTPQRGGR